MTDLLADLPPLPPPGQPPVAPFAGGLEHGLFVRRTAESGATSPSGVFLHGLGGSSTNWTDLMYLLSARFPGVAPDLPGYGRSDPDPEGKYSIGRNAKAVARLIEREAEEPVHLFGNSMGGAVAVIVAATRPDLVNTLTLISPALFTRRSFGERHVPAAWNALVSFRTTRKLPRREAADEQFRRAIRLCYSDPARLSPERHREAVDEIERRVALPHSKAVNIGMLRSILKACAGNGPASVWTLARSVSTPTLGIYGAQDRLVPVEMAARAAAAFERSRMTIFQDCGHVAQMEHPELTAQTFLQWTAALRIGD